MYAFGKGRVLGIATQGQVPEEFFLAHSDTGIFASLADQAAEIGVVQR